MTRSDDLSRIFKAADEDVHTIVAPLISQLAFLEEQISILETKPHYKINPKDPTMQKLLPAGKLYKDYVAQAKDIYRILLTQLYKMDKAGQEDSPLREFMAEFRQMYSGADGI